MKRFILAAGVAAFAIAAPATAQQGQKHGKGHAAKVDSGGGGKAERSASRGNGKAQVRAERRNDWMANNDRGKVRSELRADRREFKADNRSDKRFIKSVNRADRRELRAENSIDRNLVRVRDGDGWFVPGRGGPLGLNGCPPGLFKKEVPCMPPGQVGKSGLIGQRLSNNYRDRMLPLGLRDMYRDNDDYYYRLGNGYVYQVDRESQLVRSLLPLIGAGLGLGQMFPTSYANSYVPNYYQPFYRDNSDDYYRYANGYVYEIDRNSGRIEDMIPLMANGYGVGQMLPLGYSAYNVPYQYRSMYADSPNANYRYAPGAIYQVDPTSQLITSVASLLAPGSFGIGQRLPMGYSSYNVPLGYRDQYYDTADSMYRYNNGNIYQVDPTTQLITAVIRALI